MPVDLVSEIEILITEQLEAMPADIRSLGENRGSLIRKRLAQERGATAGFSDGEQECWRWLWRRFEIDSMIVYAQAEQSKVLPFMEFLPSAGQHFVPTHTG